MSRNHLQLDGTHAVRVVVTDSGHRAEPVTLVGDEWTRATPGDGAGLAVLHRLRNRTAVEDGFRVTMHAWVAPDDESESAMGVDQLNESWVVGGRLVVKWVTDDLEGPHPAAERLRRLADAAFEQTPTLVGVLEWQQADGDWAPLAFVQEYLAGAEDGWTWVVAEARRELGLEDGEPRPFAQDLGRLTAQLHLALAEGPPGIISDEQATAAYDDAVTALDEAIHLTTELDPASHAVLNQCRDDIIWELDGISSMAGQAAWPIHGDLHVGQILRTPDGRLHVIDFDGNPTRPPALRGAPSRRERDLAGMLQSLENVGHVVRHHHPEVDPSAVRSWTRLVGGHFLAGYLEYVDSSGHEPQMRSFDLEQMCREFVYAARHLPRWVYVPAAVLADRFQAV